MASRDLLTAAVDYMQRGWPVFMLGRSKRPLANCAGCRPTAPAHDRELCGCLTCHGFYAATLNIDQFKEMAHRAPGGLLAIRTGTPSGLVVIDIDPRHDGSVDAVLMNPTHAVVTGSGGWHLYYQHPGGTVVSRPMPDRPGVDIKADGGYVVAPPSIHPTTKLPYQATRWALVEEMRPALRAVVTTTVKRSGFTPTSGKSSNGGSFTPAAGRRRISSNTPEIRYPNRLLDSHLQSVLNSAPGRRRVTLYGAARGVARMITAGAITETDAVTALTEVGQAIGQPERDIRAAINGGFTDEGLGAWTGLEKFGCSDRLCVFHPHPHTDPSNLSRLQANEAASNSPSPARAPQLSS